MSAWTGYVYALRDPRDSAFRYVGSTDDLATRYRQHKENRTRSNAKKRRWVTELKLRGMAPIMETLEECDLHEMLAREAYWIQRLTLDGCDLLNRTLKPQRSLYQRTEEPQNRRSS